MHVNPLYHKFYVFPGEMRARPSVPLRLLMFVSVLSRFGPRCSSGP